MASIKEGYFINALTMGIYHCKPGDLFKLTGAGYDAILRVTDIVDSTGPWGWRVWFAQVSGVSPIGPCDIDGVSITPYKD